MAINLRGASYKNATLTHDEMDNNFLTFMTLSGTGSNLDISSINATEFNSTSDLKLKENLVKIDKALDKVVGLTGYTFNFINDGEKQVHSGVIAQDCVRVFPQVVRVNRDGYLNVNYDGLIGLLIEAIKDQQHQIDNLKQHIDLIQNKKG